MKKLQYILVVYALLIGYPCTTLAQDTTFNRVVTVERDYQPNIDHATIIPIQPAVLQVDVNPNPVVYSTYSSPLSIGYNIHSLQPAEIRFTPPTPPNGLLDGAIGHHNTHLNFLYQLRKKSKFTTDVYAKHDAYWGSNNTLSYSQIGLQGNLVFKKSKFYFGVDGYNQAYSINEQNHLQSLYHATAHLGICSEPQTHLQYKVQVGYKAFFTPINIEHQVHSNVDIYWSEGTHKGGIRSFAQNNFYAESKAIHNIRLQPFYSFNEEKIKLEVGVNVDMNIGTGQLLTNVADLSVAPSPHVKVEWLAVPKLLNIHAEVEGSLAMGTMEEKLHANRYFDLQLLSNKRDSSTYTPVAANVGITLHPLRTMVLDIYGGYSLYINDYTMQAVRNSASLVSYYSYLLHDYQRGHVGASLHYHFRDIITLNAKGNYYFWKNLSDNLPVYDRPDWDADLRIDVNVGPKWSLYFDNHLEGTRLAHTTTQDEKLPMVIDLNFGTQYNINRWLNVYLQLGNYLHRKNPIYYDYNTQGCHFLAGVKYAF